MVRKILERSVGVLTDSQFAIVCEIATDDIKFNRINFKKYSNLDYVMEIAVRSSIVFNKSA